MSTLIEERLKAIEKKIHANRYANEEVFLWNVIQQNPEINLLEYRICYAPSLVSTIGYHNENTTTYGYSWWLEKIHETN